LARFAPILNIVKVCAIADYLVKVWPNRHIGYSAAYSEAAVALWKTMILLKRRFRLFRSIREGCFSFSVEFHDETQYESMPVLRDM